MAANSAVNVPESITSGNTEEDWRVYEVLKAGDEVELAMDNPHHHHHGVDLTTSLRSEIAALQYKRDRLTEDLEGMRCQVRSREARCVELQMETDQLREQAARQSAIICSLKKRVHELEERERDTYATHGRNELSLQALQRDVKYHEDRCRDLETKLRGLEHDYNAEEQKKEAARCSFQDLVRRLAVALGSDICESSHMSAEALVHKASELVQETGRLRSRTSNMNDTLAGTELDLRGCRDNLDRCVNDKESLQRQCATQLLELDRLRQDKEALEMQFRVCERELSELRDKLTCSNRSLGSASGNIAQQESAICQLKDELKLREEKCQRLQHENRHTLESISILLSTPSRFIESIEASIKDRIHDILTENKDKQAQIELLREKLSQESQTLTRHISLYDQANSKLRNLDEEKAILETRLHKADAEINTCEISREGLKRDKNTFMTFLERLARALHMDEISHDIGVELHTESLILRAEQLSRLESDKLVDKTALVYQLQRRVRTLREQVQRKDLHLDLLRRKLSLQDENARVKCLLQTERDEANARTKKLLKQVERLQVQLADAKCQCRDLNAQLAEAADYKITSLERGRKIEELQKRLIESESLRTKYNRKVTMLKDQVRNTGESIEQERHMSDHSLQLIRDELARVKESLCEVNRREGQLQNFKGSVAKILGIVLPMPDYELVSRLQKLVDAHHDFTLVSRRYDDPVLRLANRSPTGGSRCTRTPDRSRYDDSGYTDGADIDDIIEDDLYNKRSNRPVI